MDKRCKSQSNIFTSHFGISFLEIDFDSRKVNTIQPRVKQSIILKPKFSITNKNLPLLPVYSFFFLPFFKIAISDFAVDRRFLPICGAKH